MKIVDTFRVIQADRRFAALVESLRAAHDPVIASGLWGSCAPILATLLADTLDRPLLYVTAHSDDADDCLDDLTTAAGTAPDLLPALVDLQSDPVGDDELASERLRLCMQLITRAENRGAGEQPRAGGPTRIVASIQALMQPVPSAAAIAARSLSLEVGQQLEPDSLLDWFEQQRFTRCDQVEVPGDYAHRGGIIDVFANAHSDAVRIEFFGDEIESIRLFDAGTQRSAHKLHSVRIPGRGIISPSTDSLTAGATGAPDKHDETTSFLSLLPADTIIAFQEPREIQEFGRTYWQRLGERAGIVPADAIFRRANDFTQFCLQRFNEVGDSAVELAVQSLPQFESKSAEAVGALFELCDGCDVTVLCDNAPEQARFEELIAEHGTRPARLDTTVGVIHAGFRWQDAAFVPHHEIFHRYRQRRTLRRVQPARPIDSFFDLNPGDYVVHVLHGIGRFRGLKTLERSGKSDEYLAIEFADEAVVHVPVSQIQVVQKYVGGFRGRPKLSKLGGSTWKRTKQRVADAVTDLAAELLALQAQRETQRGVAYPPDTTWQREFEGSFLFTETEDQLRALKDIKTDLTQPRPMDRLLCGDVGFGKTELAIRAAFKTIEYGRQVAVLVPTTVLAEQHFQTFRERLADYPFKVDVLSRFRRKKNQTQIVQDACKGRLDILIGTHRLLSKDVRFADLGLVIIDEEQRFGVDAKEHLKRLRATVDVLTLSATPIPRTLHMAMVGVRDISSLATPPLDRRAIITQVRMWDDQLIRDAIVRELNRDGQVYFVHNFVRDIHNVANQLRTLVPEARVVVGHGQMKGPELEAVMLQFVNREADVLVSTNIIESGIDIPSANTIFIHRAERFGLADLHQLRGRVGRSKHRAYCYLTLSPKHPVKEQAARRLKAVEQYSELGAGFQIAMRDLELRGAGNMLGPEQSGHIEAVGYEMYCQMLEQAVHRLKDDPVAPWRPVNLELAVTASIPRAYVRAERQRMEIYKRLASARTAEDVRSLDSDLRDAFGPMPEDVRTLLTLAEIRVLAQPWSIRSIVLDPPDVIFAVDDLQVIHPLFETGPGSPRVPDGHTVHWRLPNRLLKPPHLLSTLTTQLATVAPAAPAPAVAGVS